MPDKIEVVSFGGGGLYWLNKAFLQIPEVRVTNIVGDHDSGGFTGELRKIIGCSGQVGDGTRALCGFCPNDPDLEWIARSWLARFDKETGWGGKSIKNFVYAGLYLEAKKCKRPVSAIFDVMGRMLHVEGHRVFGAADRPTHLKTLLRNGVVLEEESVLDTMAKHQLFHQPVHGIEDVSLDPAVSLTPRSEEAIVRADLITLGPGDTWSTLMGILSVGGIPEAFRQSKASIILILNLMTKIGETDGYKLEDFMEAFRKKIGRRVDRVFINNARVHPEIKKLYREKQKVPLGSFAALKGRRFLVHAPFAAVRDNELVHNHLVLAVELQNILKELEITPSSSAGSSGIELVRSENEIIEMTA